MHRGLGLELYGSGCVSMGFTITFEQAAALAPDAASAKAGQSLANPKPWSRLGKSESAVWGACQGSGKDPYQTIVDWEGPAFKCSCPSRKFPCKHGLGLLMLLAQQPGRFAADAAPDWVDTWISSRRQKAEAKASKPASEPDEAARAKRSAQRASRISEGLDQLELWLQDLLRQGLINAPTRGFDFWDLQGARLVDAQAPGVARRVRELGGIAASGEGWQQRMIAAIGRIVLLIRAYRQLDELPAETQADVRAAVGLTIPQEDVLAAEPVRDRWMIAGQSVEADERIRTQRTWLMGISTGRTALILDFAAGPASFKTTLVPGSIVDAGLCWFPSAAPVRALIREVHMAVEQMRAMPPARTVSEAFGEIGSRIAANPWTESQPVSLRSVTPVADTARWIVRDESGDAMPCRPDFALLAASRGNPVDVFGEWDGSTLRVLAIGLEGRVRMLSRMTGA